MNTEVFSDKGKSLINKKGEFVKGFGTQKTPEMIEDSIKEIL